MSKVGIQVRGTGAVRTGLRGGGIAKRGTGAALKTGGRAALWNGGPPNTGRTNLLEQLGRVEAERSNPNRRAEISRVHGELNRGYAKGGRAGLKHGGKPWGTGPKPGTEEYWMQQVHKPRKRKALGGASQAIKKALKPKGVFKKDNYKRPWEKPPQLRKSIKERREELRKKARKSGGHSKIIFADEWEKIDPGLQKGLFKKEGGRIGLKEGGNGKWIQKATKGMVKTKPCTGKKFGSKTCPPGSRRYNLAKTFKKMGRERKAEA
jgi:hypothetical protein